MREALRGRAFRATNRRFRVLKCGRIGTDDLRQFARSEEILGRGVQTYGDVSEFSAFLAFTLCFAGRCRGAISILLKLLDTASGIHIKRCERALRYYAAILANNNQLSNVRTPLVGKLNYIVNYAYGEPQPAGKTDGG